MRFPPPPRRYSPVAVIAPPPETVSRPNSRSIAAKSSRSISKNSFPVMAAGMLMASSLWRRLSVGPVVRKLRINPKVLLLEQGNDGLQRVPILAAHAHQIPLNRGLSLVLRVLDHLDNLARFFDRDALLHGDALFCRSSGRGFDRPIGQSL